MFNDSLLEIRKMFAEVLQQNLTPEAWQWLTSANDFSQLDINFTRVPRKTGRQPVQLTASQSAAFAQMQPRIILDHWATDRLARVWLLMNISDADKAKYLQAVDALFANTDVNELVALYSALPYLSYAPHWQARCAEGIRSNIGDVLEAIICNNPYPAAYLETPAFNQLILKAFFTEKPVHKIMGLDARLNEALAHTLHDYAHERWAAHRMVNLQLWRCVAKFINEQNFGDIEKIAASANANEQAAAALACNDSSYPPAKILLQQLPHLQEAITQGQLSWTTLAETL